MQILQKREGNKRRMNNFEKKEIRQSTPFPKNFVMDVLDMDADEFESGGYVSALPDDIIPTMMYLLWTLPENWINTILLLYQRGMTLDEASKELGVTKQNLSKRVQNAKAKLRDMKSLRGKMLESGVRMYAFRESDKASEEELERAYKAGYESALKDAAMGEEGHREKASEKLSGMLSIHNMGLTRNDEHKLWKAGCRTMRDIVMLGNKIYEINYLGDRSIQRIFGVLERYGVDIELTYGRQARRKTAKTMYKKQKKLWEERERDGQQDNA